ncbi:hypothetical protein [Echinicola sp. 20G]|uniref:DoxX family protein n=1 Tax=Echinicola sp. 20G TaxID=2781961 RepID=UPI00190FF91B|nr:hypothetical protein [Echinicola sp. 20G]
MLPFYVLIIVFILSGILIRLIHKSYKWTLAGKLALSVMLGFTALGHFLFPEGMSKMLPDFIPMKEGLIYLTGLIEFAAALGIHFKGFRKVTGWLLILFFVIILPANIKAAMDNLNYKTGNYDGPGLSYLWFRVPFQLLLMGWTYYFVIRDKG